jgi:hypothetical protein
MNLNAAGAKKNGSGGPEPLKRQEREGNPF